MSAEEKEKEIRREREKDREGGRKRGKGFSTINGKAIFVISLLIFYLPSVFRNYVIIDVYYFFFKKKICVLWLHKIKLM